MGDVSARRTTRSRTIHMVIPSDVNIGVLCPDTHHPNALALVEVEPNGKTRTSSSFVDRRSLTGSEP